MTEQAYPLTEKEAETLRSASRLESLRGEAQVLSQSVLVPGSPEQLWPVLAYTDFLNQKVGMQATQNTYLTRNYGSTWMHAQTKNSGLAVAYEELPYEWSAPDYYHVERIHSKGPLKYLRFGVQLQAKTAEQTEVVCEIRFVSHLPTPIAKLLVGKEIEKFIKLFRELGLLLASGTPPLRAFFEPLTGPTKEKIQTWSQNWQAFIASPEVRLALADYIFRAPERLAYRLRPIELAEAYALDPLAVLKACLILSREGDLHLMWDCRCPGCKGPKESFQHLGQLKDQAYCPSCAVSYGLAFDQNLELTFQPAKKLRETQEKYFCAGSPGNTQHISWQQNLQGHETRQFELQLPPGPYVLRSLSCENELILMILPPHKPNPDAQNQLRVEVLGQFTTPELAPQDVILCNAQARLQLLNQNSHEITVSLENLHWQSQAVTAAQVQAVQAFHDLFPEEVLGPDEALPLQSQIFLAVEILNPVEGDTELLQWLQSRIQAHEGACLQKTQASVLGIFASPFEALSAAWDLRQELANLNPLYPEPIQLGVGIAEGPCEVFVAAGRLAYRGLACERAQTALERSAGRGLVISETLLQRAEMQVFLQDPFVSAQVLAAADPLDSSHPWVLFEFANGVEDLF
jgi:hypothetical protein